MTWVQVECSNGSRYVAPSHGRPLPNFSGAAQLFPPPLSLRRLHTCNVEGASGDGERVCVLMDQRDLTGHLGITTVIVGSEGEADGLPTLSHAPDSSLRLLLERVFAVLSSTNNHGVAVMLDALCTRAPPPFTVAAAARLSTVAEDDGVRRAVPPSFQPLPLTAETAAATKHAASTSSNLRFLQRLTQGGGDGREHPSALHLLPANALTVAAAKTPANSKTSAAAPAPPPRPLTYAAAVRRQALLYFVPCNVVPLSLLHTQAQWSSRSKHTKTNAAASTMAAQTLDTALGDNGAEVPVADQLQALRRHMFPLPRGKGAASTEVLLTCTSALACKSLRRSASWSAAAQIAEDSGRLLLLLLFRLLVTRTLRPTHAAALRHVLLCELWEAAGDVRDAAADAPHSSSPAPVPLLLAATYTPSGLLAASAGFYRCLTHDECILLSAAAVDRLARFPHVSNTQPLASAEQRSCFANLVRWTSWPMRLSTPFPRSGSSAPAAAIVDVLMVTVGDALAICLCFPRLDPQDAAGLAATSVSPVVQSALTLQSVQRHLERAVAKADRRADAALIESLVHVCAHSTAPYTGAFYDALFATTAVEEALAVVGGEVVGASAEEGDTVSPPETCAKAVEELRHLLRRHENPQAVQNAGQTAPPPQAAGNPQAVSHEQQQHQQQPAVSPAPNATPPGHAAPPKPRTKLQHLFARLPLGKRRSSSRTRGTSVAADNTSNANTAAVFGAAGQTAEQVHSVGSGEVTDAVASPSSASSAAAALLALPFEYVLCYTAAVITRNEMAVMRSKPAVGLHSFFVFQQKNITLSKSKRRGEAAQLKAATSHSLPNSAWVTASPRFGLSYARHRLQQPHFPAAMLPDELGDVEGMSDGQGGRHTLMEDPTLTLPFSLHPSDAGKEEGHVDSARPVMTVVLPEWSLLHIVPVEPFGGTFSDNAEGNDVDEDNASTDTASSGAGDAPPQACCPALGHDDAQLLTSLSFSSTLHVERRRAKHVGQPTAAVVPGAAAGNTALMNQAPGAAATVPPTMQAPSSPLLPPPTPPPSANHTHHDKVGTTFVTVANICGDVSGATVDVLHRALQKQALSKAEESKAVDGNVLAAPVDGDPFTLEYAAGTTTKVKELCREVMLCQEAALALLEAAASTVW